MPATKLKDILGDANLSEKDRITALKQKTINVPAWNGEKGLVKEYDTHFHPVNNKAIYPDEVTGTGVTKVTRIALDFMRLASKRMTELVTGIPIKRVYKPKNDRQKEIAGYLESIYERNRIDAVNIQRCHLLFSTCEIMTLWYAVEQPNTDYGFNSSVKLRNRTFSPMSGDSLYPFFDEYGDMVAMSVEYIRTVGKNDVTYFDTYTADAHIKWSNESGEWQQVEREPITLGKIPCVYACRMAPIWENTAGNVFEMEWALSRNGNYIRTNSKPRFVVSSDEVIQYGDEKDKENNSLSVIQLPENASANYVTWQQATESLKFHVEQLRSLFFTQLQLPDWSYEKMSQQALSGESRKQLFIDAQLKVQDEKGPLLEFFDREINVVKAFLKTMLPPEYQADIETLDIETIITPFTISDEKETIDKLLAANGNEPMISQRESIEQLGWSKDVDKTLADIQAQSKADAFELTE